MKIMKVKKVVYKFSTASTKLYEILLEENHRLMVTVDHAFKVIRNENILYLPAESLLHNDNVYIDDYAFKLDGSLRCD